MNERLQTIMVANGAAVFLVGMAAGFPLAFELIGKIALWPFPGSMEWNVPGDVRGWRMAHLEGVLNGLTLIGVAAVGHRLTLSARAQAFVAWGLIVTSWGNMIASCLGPLVGGRGLEFTDGAGNRTVYLLFVLAIIAVIAAMALVLKGAVASLYATKTPDASTS